jgi:hypothetical protein
MQCPRCGQQNSPSAGWCARCALPMVSSEAPTGELPPVPVAPQGPTPGTRPSEWISQQPRSVTYTPTYAPERPATGTHVMPRVSAGPGPAETTHSSMARRLKPFVLSIGALAGLVYAGWGGTARRSAFTDAASKSLDELKSSDRLDSVLLVVCTVVVALAIGWMFVGWSGPPSTLRVGVLASLGVAAVAAAVAGYLLGTWEQDADTASRGYLMLAIAFALAAVALLLELVAARPPLEETDGRRLASRQNAGAHTRVG